jgi:esterase
MATLHHATVAPPTDTATSTVLFLHGILGSGANLRGLAQRYVAARPEVSVTLIDLRGQGRSPHGQAPHTVEACAQDLLRLEPSLGLPVSGVLGHSFGGKVALAYHALRPSLSRVHVLDSAPFPRAEATGSEQTMRVLAMLEAGPEEFADRDAFQAFVLRHGHVKAVADWLAMNLTRSEGGLRFRPDLRQIRALLDDYFSRDLWPVLAGSAAEVDVVIGGRSYVWDADDVERLQQLEGETRGRIRGVILETAGHWVHVDDLAGTLAAVVRS